MGRAKPKGLRFARAVHVQAGVRQLLHGIIVDRDHQSRDLLGRVLADLDWNTCAFEGLPDIADHLPEAWAVFVSTDLIDEAGQKNVAWLRQRAPEAAIVLMQASTDEDQAREYRQNGADAVLQRPLADASVIDAVGKALVRRRR